MLSQKLLGTSKHKQACKEEEKNNSRNSSFFMFV